MKNNGVAGRIWTFLSALIFFAMCGLVVYAVNSSNTFDKYKVDNLNEERVLYAEDWDDLMDDLNNRFVPEGAIVAFEGECPEENGRYEYAPYTNGNGSITYCVKSLGGERSCEASGGCPLTPNGGTCTTYENNAPVGSACVPTTSICNNGQWSTPPKQYASCTSYCEASGACPRKANGETCNTFESSMSVGDYCVGTLSTCQSNGQWDRTPKNDSTCTVYCAKEGACIQMENGLKCKSYDVSSSTDCSSHKIESICRKNGKWDPAPGHHASCKTTTPSYSSSSGGGGDGVQCGYRTDGLGEYIRISGTYVIGPFGPVPNPTVKEYCRAYPVQCATDANHCYKVSGLQNYPNAQDDDCCCTVGNGASCKP